MIELESLGRLLKNVIEAVATRQKQAKKRSFCVINERFDPVVNAVAATQIIFQQSVRSFSGYASRASLRGFTLIELMIVLAIMAILATAAMPLRELVVQREKEQELRTALRQIRNAIDAYKQAADDGRIEKKEDESGYPRTLDDLVIGVPDIKSPEKKVIYFLRRLPRDPMHQDMDVAGIEETPAADTWGKRSYESSPENPREGDDVFDVYSLSDAVGLNGIEYSKW